MNKEEQLTKLCRLSGACNNVRAVVEHDKDMYQDIVEGKTGQLVTEESDLNNRINHIQAVVKMAIDEVDEPQEDTSEYVEGVLRDQRALMEEILKRLKIDPIADTERSPKHEET